MSSMVPDDAPKPRASHLRKWADFNGYGFNLHAEKGKAGQFIGKVDPDSPAESAGLKPGDRIVEVNDVNIGNENHQQVVVRIKAGYNGSLDETKLLVVDNEADQYYKSKKLVIRGDMPNVVGLAAPPIRGGETIVTVSNGHIAEPEPEPVVTETVTTVTETVITEAQVNKEPEPEPALTETEVAVAAVAVAAAAEETRREPTPPPREPTPPPREPTPPPREPTPPPVVVQQTETTVVTTTTTVNGISEPEPAPEPKGPIDPATGLELNVSVAEMKERLSSRRKRDSRNAALNFKDKYEMFQRL
ncbi:unnamed protein product [Owenia fusiformis]|uniref:Uncharacterized protein n=1 Tax=Owenia fusiformis TaxID=6347 RepID=A0A8J1TYS4_OWEFU|nr:unnamed protein product [Owenia fusiformis]